MIAEPVTSPHDGPQTVFLESAADIAIYGGAAGGGKSYALLLEPLRFVNVPGFQAVIFRRTAEQVRTAGGLWDESSGLYPLVGGHGREHTLDWRWDDGGVIRFEQLQHEQTKMEYQGAQITMLGFDELTHFTESQFFYMLSRNRSSCGVKPYVRATTNPDASSWVARLIAWWIDQETGYAIPDRSGVARWFVRDAERLAWAATRDELVERYPEQLPKSLTFVPAKLADNPTLMKADPNYRANLLALPRVERERLLGGNWKSTESTLIEDANLRRYACSGDLRIGTVAGQSFMLHPGQCRRFATIDTAGTSREKAEEKKGKPASWSVCAVWDYHAGYNVLLLVYVWRERASWAELKDGVRRTLVDHGVTKAYLENAHHAPALKDELRGIQCDMVGPVIDGMAESHRGAKLERAIASGLLSRIEDHRLFIPDDERPWIRTFRDELTSWGGLPDEPADQIDCASYAAFVCRKLVSQWGGPINTRKMARL